MTESEHAAWRLGVIDGIKMYAWWRDGVEYVGSGTRTLKQAIKDVEDVFEEKRKERTKLTEQVDQWPDDDYDYCK